LVSGVSWTGGQTNIDLYYDWNGPTITGTIYLTKAVRSLDDGYTKHLLLRSTDDQMHLIYGQEKFATEDLARSGNLPVIPDAIKENSVDIAYIIVGSGTVSLEGSIYDIRPLPFNVASYIGGSGGGAVANDHGNLIGLDDDDHTQYILSDGTRPFSGKVNYISHPNFSVDTEIVDKKYVDDEIDYAITYTSEGIAAIDEVDDTLSTTSSTTYQTKLTIVIPAYTGRYRIGWSMGYNSDANNKDVYVRVYNITDDVVLSENNQQTNNNLNWWTFAGFAYVDFTGSSKTFQIQYKAGTANCSVRNARLEAWKIY
jgi:hypothetical protein